MKKLLFVLSLAFCTNLQAKNYYISATGNDSNDGLTVYTPWQTIKKVNSFSFASNDYVFFNRGNTFYGAIVVNQNNIFYDAYGSGAKPIITGLSIVTGWINLGGNIWEAPVINVKKGVNLVMRNGLIQQVGRYPNADAANGGYLTYTAAANTSITGPAMSSTTNWTGAEVAIRANRWEIIRQTVTNHSGGVVSFASIPTPRLNYGYFFQRDPRTLDKDGEWWHNASNSKLRMYFSSNNPNLYSVQIATIDTLFKSIYNSVTVSNLAFNGSGNNAIFTNGGTGMNIKSCDVNNSGAEAITTWFSYNVTVDNCTVKNSLGSAIRVMNINNGAVNLSVTNCNVDSTALIVGMETSGLYNGGAGIFCRGGDNLSIQKNIITNSGFCGIDWIGNNVYIQNNYINKFCTVRDDNGGIYTLESGGTNLPTRTNRNIIGNIIVGGMGANNGSNEPNGAYVCGIYLDQGTRTILMDANTIANINGQSFHGNNNSYITVTNNTFFGNRTSSSLQRFSDGPIISNIIIKKNIMYPYRLRFRDLGINTPTLRTILSGIQAMGILDSNYYSLRNGLDTSLLGVSTYANLTNYTEANKNFAYLTSTIKTELHSKNVENTGTLEYNASNSPRVITFSGLSKKDVFGTVYNNSVTIPAWKSIVLITNGTTNSTNKPPVANAGADKSITLPKDTTTLVGVGTDAGGTISSYSWVQLSGPSTPTIAISTTASTILNKLVQGTYKYQLTVTDNLGATGRDTVLVNVNAASTALPPSSLQPAVNPGNLINGLDYTYYEGSWTALPAFSTLTPVKAGITSTFNLAPALKTSQYGLNFSGFINVPADGQYTFYTSSDDGSSLYIDNVLTVSNDGIHATVEKSGTIGLKAGLHAISGQFFQQAGGAVFTVSYSAAGITKQTIPSSVLFRSNLYPAVYPTGVINGLKYKYYEGNWTALPSFSTLTPIKTGTTNNFNLTLANRTLQYGFDFSGFITVPSDGQYTFFTSSDDGSNLYIDNVLTVSNDGVHATVEKSGTIGLKAGKHYITGLFFQQAGGAVFVVSYQGNGISKQAIPASSLFYTNNTVARINNGTGSIVSTPSLSAINATSAFTNFKITSFPNPTTTEFGLFVEGGTTEKIEIVVMNVEGQIVFKTEGTSNRKYKFGNSFMPGLYIIKVMQGNTIQMLKVIKG